MSMLTCEMAESNMYILPVPNSSLFTTHFLKNHRLGGLINYLTLTISFLVIWKKKRTGK